MRWAQEAWAQGVCAQGPDGRGGRVTALNARQPLSSSQQARPWPRVPRTATCFCWAHAAESCHSASLLCSRSAHLAPAPPAGGHSQFLLFPHAHGLPRHVEISWCRLDASGAAGQCPAKGPCRSWQRQEGSGCPCQQQPQDQPLLPRRKLSSCVQMQYIPLRTACPQLRAQPAAHVCQRVSGAATPCGRCCGLSSLHRTMWAAEQTRCTQPGSDTILLHRPEQTGCWAHRPHGSFDQCWNGPVSTGGIRTPELTPHRCQAVCPHASGLHGDSACACACASTVRPCAQRPRGWLAQPSW